ncbi:MAG: hydrogenase formation protein HypD [Desulfuromonadia bacterium]
MRFQEEFRDRAIMETLRETLHREASRLPREVTFMEVCGTHTMSIYQYGIRSLLPPGIRLVSGPGCPVCVTPNDYLDRAIAMSRLPDVTIATFGDMMRVPGSSSSLMHERARGGDIRVVYSPLDAVRLAGSLPGRLVVFLGVGFETTAPTVAASILAAAGMKNFFVLASHKTMPRPMEILGSDPEIGITGFICPAHVSTVTGVAPYLPLAERGLPCVITGFEPTDVLRGIIQLVRQVVEGRSRVEIEYSRAVKPEGNPRARMIMEKVFEPCDAIWRGIGMIPGSGLAIREEYGGFDAARNIPVEVPPSVEHPGCRCGDVLKGKLSPTGCPLFGRVCTPDEPVGSCMVSSEGTCAAAWKYGGER